MAKDHNKALIYDLIRTIAECIAGPPSHGYAKHHQRGNEFTNPRLGAPVQIDEDPADVVQHAYNVLADPESRVINTVGKRFYVYNKASNTLCIVNPGAGDKDGGTMYRLDPNTDGSGPEWHTHVTKLDAAAKGIPEFKDAPGGLAAALQRDPGLAKDLRGEYAKVKDHHADLEREKNRARHRAPDDKKKHRR
jgi:hypothetical protein